MTPIFFIVRATVTDPAKRAAFDKWYAQEHLPDAVKTFGAQKAWRFWSESDPAVHQATYQMTDRAAVKCNNWIDGDEVVEIDAQHDGYNGVRHRRRFRLNKVSGDLELQDSLEGDGTHSFEWFFHTLPGTTVNINGARAGLCYGSGAVELQADDDFGWESIEGWYSPSYGVRHRSQVVAARLTRQLPFTLTIRIVNRNASDPRNK